MSLMRYRNVMKEWDYPHNDLLGLDPHILTYGSNKNAWWTCSRCGEKWQTPIVNRTKGIRGKPTGCPYCCNPPLKPSKKRNLKVLFPDVARQLHTEKNGGLQSEGVLPFSNARLWFHCDNGHSYQMVVAARTKQGQGCPKCNKTVSRVQLRVFSEMCHFFPDAVLEDRSCGVEVDVFIPALGLGVEVDGYRWHKDKGNKDREKNKVVEGLGYYLFRIRELPLGKIRSVDVLYPENPSDSDILDAISHIFESMLVLGVDIPYGKPKMFYEEVKYQSLLASRGIVPKDKSVSTRFPELVCLWSDKNKLNPAQVRYGEHRLIWWKCEEGHEYRTDLWNMIAAVKRGASSKGCPYCSGRKATTGCNLAVSMPHVAAEWDFKRNGELRPEDFRPKSNKKVWWKCAKGHSWRAVIQSRTSGCGCPVCFGRKPQNYEHVVQ